jgi:hypothetical protein
VGILANGLYGQSPGVRRETGLQRKLEQGYKPRPRCDRGPSVAGENMPQASIPVRNSCRFLDQRFGPVFEGLFDLVKELVGDGAVHDAVVVT